MRAFNQRAEELCPGGQLGCRALDRHASRWFRVRGYFHPGREERKEEAAERPEDSRAARRAARRRQTDGPLEEDGPSGRAPVWI
ncbi:unnamed protein product [Arctogadus glacialis]